jgi:hypothetical protein
MEKLVRKIQIQKKSPKNFFTKAWFGMWVGVRVRFRRRVRANLREAGKVDWIKKSAEK